MFRRSSNSGFLLYVIALVCLLIVPASAQTTQFTYQGSLSDGASPANGAYDFQFKLFDSLNGGAQVGSTITVPDLNVVAGVFTTALNFGSGVFSGPNRWLEISVRPGASTGAYTTLTPRQQISSTPYAVKSLNAATADGLSVACVNCVTSSQIGSLPTGSSNYIQNTTTQQANAGFNISGSGIAGGTLFAGSGLFGLSSDGAAVYASSPIWAGFFDGKVYVTGSMGIGTDPPQSTLHVEGAEVLSTGASAGFKFRNRGSISATDDWVWFSNNNVARFWRSGVGDLVYVKTNGNVGIGIADPQTRLDVAGTTKTHVLQITGGADFSENFDISDQNSEPEIAALPGMVVSINPDQPGKLTLSRQAYDPRVAGIISGAGGVKTGMLMGQAGTVADGKQPVALTGRVYCWVDATNGPIAPGDLLTTSNTPGHAMKVTDHTKAQGAIIGKAMTGLKEGKGLVLVLVTLQ